MTRSTLALLLALLALPASAQTIYKCVDANGGILISNSRVNKNCRPVVTEPDGGSPRPRAPAATSNPTPAGFPRVTEDVQKARDNDRRLILEQELTGEQRSLDLARKELTAQEALITPGDKADRVAPYRDRVARHERNIEAIQRELNAMK